MTKVVLIVEGHGDALSFPSLLARASNLLGEAAYCSHPIRSGGYPRLLKPGGLEKFVRLAASQPGCERIIVALDLDDGCAAEESQAMSVRCADLEYDLNIPIRICFCVREYESWLIEEFENLRNATSDIYSWNDNFGDADPSTIRDAKSRVSVAINRNYKETIDQLRLTKALNVESLYIKSRSFRKFVKCIGDVYL